jgi:TonB family protein
MNAGPWTLAIVLALGSAASAQAQIQLPSPGAAGMPVHASGSVPAPLSGDFQSSRLAIFAVTSNLMKHNLVEGSPFAATGTIGVEQALADGSAIKNSYNVAVWRDSQGRMRVEYALKLPGLDSSHRMVMVWDPESSTTMTWSIGNPEVPVVVLMRMPAAGANQRRSLSTGPAASVPPPGVRSDPAMPNTSMESGSMDAGGSFYYVGGAISAPVLLHSVEAGFTDEALRAKYQGVCLVKLIVDAQGDPKNPRVVRPLGMGLDEKALEAVREYRFRPAMRDGTTPVPVMITVAVSFNSQTGAPPAQAPLRNVTLPDVGNRSLQNVKTEQLGSDTIAGVYVTGVRATTTIPAGTVGNDRDITVISETWTSPDLKITVRQVTDDPRSGRVTTELTNITRSDPDPALFQAPEGYTVRDMSLPTPPTQ